MNWCGRYTWKYMWMSLWDIWIENCDDKWMLLKLECIYSYGSVSKNICE
jgi:hypothetical protein